MNFNKQRRLKYLILLITLSFDSGAYDYPAARIPNPHFTTFFETIEVHLSLTIPAFRESTQHW